jgi:TolA-binding protein
MSNSVKVTLYAVLVFLASISGYFALSSFGKMMSRAGERNSDLEQIEPERKPADAAVETADTTPTNAAATNTLSSLLSTNVASASNNISSASNQVVATAAPEETNAPAKKKPSKSSASKAGANVESAKASSHMGLWLGLFVVSVLGVGLMVAHDVSQFMGNRALKVLYNDDGEGVKDPEYDKAEEVWANGDHLEAIKLMREYLAKNPREQHVAIRIAEIYEKDLKNNLAAALEYEEVLKHKLQPERWGWAAIHLCNLYFRLNQEQKGFELLRRIVNEHPNTAAAEKARKRLGQVDGSVDTDQIATEPQVSAAPRVTATAPAAPAPPAAGNLPPGFRPKK